VVTLGRRNRNEKERFNKVQCRKKKGPTDYLSRRHHKNRLESLLTTTAPLSEGRKPCRVACSFPSPSHFSSPAAFPVSTVLQSEQWRTSLLFIGRTEFYPNLNALDQVRTVKKKSNKISQILCFIRKTSV
jgi:hypothetical protein